MKALYEDAIKKNYWLEMINPITKNTGIGICENGGAVMDYKNKPLGCKGFVLLDISDDKTKYKIYGCNNENVLEKEIIPNE